MSFVLAVAFDIDHTMRNWRADVSADEIEWNGHVDYWKTLCEQLKKICNKCDANVYFGIATAKEAVDSLVKDAVICLQKYLVVLEQNQERLLIDNDSWTLSFDGRHYDYKTLEDKYIKTNKPTCVYVTNGKSKVNALENMRVHYGIQLPANVILFDNSLDVGEDVMNAGFSFVSAEKINAGENTKEQRDIETINAMLDLVVKVLTQLLELKLSHLKGLLLANSKVEVIKEFCSSQVPNIMSLRVEKEIFTFTLIQWIAGNDSKLLRQLMERKVFTLAEIRKVAPDCQTNIVEIFEDYPYTTNSITKLDFLLFPFSNMDSDTGSTSDSLKQTEASTSLEVMCNVRNHSY